MPSRLRAEVRPDPQRAHGGVSDLVHGLWQIAHRARASPEEAHGHISVAARHSVHLRAIGAKSLRAHVEARLLLSNPWRHSPWIG